MIRPEAFWRKEGRGREVEQHVLEGVHGGVEVYEDMEMRDCRNIENSDTSKREGVVRCKRVYVPKPLLHYICQIMDTWWHFHALWS